MAVSLIGVLLAATAAVAGAPAQVASPVAPMAAMDADRCDGRPVLMLVRGSLKDRERLMAYAAALRASGLYPKYQGYYLNSPRPVAVFEGTPPVDDSVLIVRFPCLANARAFWNSETYQQKIRPLRLNPSAGDFLVTVMPELPVPDYVKPAEPPLP